MKKIKLICAAFIFLFVCCLFYKPVSAETVSTNQNGYNVYVSEGGYYYFRFNTKTGTAKKINCNGYIGSYPPYYYKGYLYDSGSSNGSGSWLRRISKTGNISTVKGPGLDACYTIYKNRIYYVDKHKIMRCTLTGKKKKTLKTISKKLTVSNITVLKKKLYFVAENNYGECFLYTASLSGKNIKKVCPWNASYAQWTYVHYTQGNSIYFIDNADEDGCSIYKYTGGWSSPKRVATCPYPIDRIAGINKNNIYFTISKSSDTYFCRAPLSGGSYKRIKKIPGDLIYVGKGNYCMYVNYSKNKWYRMTLDGKKEKAIVKR